MKKNIIWTLIAILIIIAATLGILYFTTDLFKTPEQLFYRNFSNSLKIVGQDFKNYNEFVKELKKEMDSPIEVEGEITAKVTSNEPSAKEVAEVLEKGKIKYNEKMLGKEQKMQSDITLNYDNKDIVTLNVLKDKEQYGIKINDLYEKYISVENNNLKELFKKLGLDDVNVPDRIEIPDYYELLNVDEDTAKYIAETYGNIVKENIPADCYSVEKDVETIIEGKNIKTNAYKLSLTSEQLENLIRQVLEKLKTDDITLNLIVNKCNQLINIFQNITEETNITKEDVISTIDTVLENIGAKENTTIEITVYGSKDNMSRIESTVESNGNILLKEKMDMIKADKEEKLVVNIDSDEAKINYEIKEYDDNKLDCTIGMNAEGTKIEVFVKQETKATKDITIEEFTSENSAKINDMTSEEIGQLIQTIYNNALTVLPQKMQLLGININNI